IGAIIVPSYFNDRMRDMSTDYSDWHDSKRDLQPRRFNCGFCGTLTGSRYGYTNLTTANCEIYLCVSCGFPTFMYQGRQYPGPRTERKIKNLPESVDSIYTEIKDSVSNSSYTAAILLGRKLIMHLAVDVAKAKEGQKFIEYVQFLKESNFIPPNGDALLAYI